MKEADVKFKAWASALLPYAQLEFPAADFDCEALRVFVIGLASLAKQFHARSAELIDWNRSQPDECRAQNKELYGPKTDRRLGELEGSFGRSMNNFEGRVRGCMAPWYG
jgi:hypothetical protein